MNMKETSKNKIKTCEKYLVDFYDINDIKLD
jgi:hypothetical protein